MFDELVNSLTQLAPPGTFFNYAFNLLALIALLLVSLTCGAVGSLVVGGRLAFFSDALAHCAFAGVSLGFLFFQIFLADVRSADEFWDWVTPIMAGFGVFVGAGIVAVRGRTGLSSDTVIGVFFAAAIGLAALLRPVIKSQQQLLNLDDFLFGDPLLVRPQDIAQLAAVALLTAIALFFLYNHLLLSGFNTSLALSRRVPARLANYLFVMLLALIVNIGLRCMGALLINALLVVPAATAANLSRNMRQFFWLTLALCVGTSVAGLFASWEVHALTGSRVRLGISGAIVVLSVGLFGMSLAVEPVRRAWLRRRHSNSEPSPARVA